MTESALWRLPAGMRINHDLPASFLISPFPENRTQNASDTGSTRENHIKAVKEAITAINASPCLEKVVLAQKTIVPSPQPPSQVYQKLCSLFPQAFCYLWQRCENEWWLAATPELLIDYDTSSGELRTMALAGTLPLNHPWDEKNMREQQYVVDFISSCLQSLGFSVTLGQRADLLYGEIKHLCTPITATSPTPVSPDIILASLSPTPAVCGTPRDLAALLISRLEPFNRQYYAGYVGVKTPDRVLAYVNLRCAKCISTPARGYEYHLYSGGGITSLSHPETEWEETRRKISTLKSLL